MKRIYSYITKEKEAFALEVGSRVSFKSINSTIYGIVKKIQNGKALILAFYMNSSISQWIDLNNLIVIS